MNVRVSTFITLVTVIVFLCGGLPSTAQVKDSIKTMEDSVNSTLPVAYTGSRLDSLLKKNQLLNTSAPSISLAVKQKNKQGKEFLFYVLGITILLLSLFKVFYSRYFNNIFRVFFNTSLRQNQLTDLLIQAKLPSLIFNIFFVISAGLYAWLLLNHYQHLSETNNYTYILLAMLFVGIIYSVKFLSLKLFGWISGSPVITDRYIFVIFLINKIIGILLIPFIIMLAFSPAGWMPYIIVLSALIIGILLLLRYLRTYGLIRNELKINRFHFLIYVAGMEILPILILYKLVFQVLL